MLAVIIIIIISISISIAHFMSCLSTPMAVAGVGLSPFFVCLSVCLFARYLKNHCS